MPVERPDEELVARAIATGSPADYDVLIRRYQSDVRNWLRHLTGDPSRADDLAQETFIRAWERLHTINDGEGPGFSGRELEWSGLAGTEPDGVAPCPAGGRLARSDTTAGTLTAVPPRRED